MTDATPTLAVPAFAAATSADVCAPSIMIMLQ